jgi:hypothetical protein
MTEERPTEPTPEGPPPEAPPPDALPDAPPPPSPAPPASTPPTYTPPPIAPPAAQPTVAWAPPPVAGAVVGGRTTLSLAAGILLVVLGALGVLFSLVVLTIGRSFVDSFDFTNLPGVEGVGDPGQVVGGVITFLGIFVLACSTFYIVGGVGIMRSKSWGRVIGIVIGILAGLLWLGSVAGGGGQGRADGVGFALVLLALHAYIAVVLLFFWRTKATA